MTHPLDGCWAKIARSHEHLDALQAEVAQFPDEAKDVAFAEEFDPQTNKIRVFVERAPSFPVHWSLIAADAFQNLRTALNYLAWELATWNLKRKGEMRDPNSQTQFPIAIEENRFNLGQVADLGPDHIALIKRLQPFDPDFIEAQRTSGLPPSPGQVVQLAPLTPQLRLALASGHPLARLQRLSNEDKDQILTPVGLASPYAVIGATSPDDCIILGGESTPGGFNVGDQWDVFDVRPTGANPKVNMQNTFIFTVAFGGIHVEDLPKLGVAVTYVISEFEPVSE